MTLRLGISGRPGLCATSRFSWLPQRAPDEPKSIGRVSCCWLCASRRARSVRVFSFYSVQYRATVLESRLFAITLRIGPIAVMFIVSFCVFSYFVCVMTNALLFLFLDFGFVVRGPLYGRSTRRTSLPYDTTQLTRTHNIEHLNKHTWRRRRGLRPPLRPSGAYSYPVSDAHADARSTVNISHSRTMQSRALTLLDARPKARGGQVIGIG